MAWRVAQSIVRGEVDNREQGHIQGRIWLLGRPEPIELQLRGNPYRDLAGCCLTFVNPTPAAGDRTDLHALQRGVSGDMTASRKVRVLDVSVEEAKALSKQGKPVPEHRGNSLYLEWFSEANGRVVIESADYHIAISEPAWTMTDEEERVQRVQNQDAMRDWLDHLAGDVSDEDDYDPDDDTPMDEFEWEQFLRESDKLTDKYMEVFEKYKNHPDCEKLVAREMGWNWLDDALDAEERGTLVNPGATEYDEDEEEVGLLEPNPLTEGVDWVRDEDGRIHHPLTARSHRLSMSLWRTCDELGLLGDGGSEEVRDMVFQTQTLSAKLAGALDHLAYDDEREPGFIVACLKRALGYLHAAISASETAHAKEAMTLPLLNKHRKGLFEVREQILYLMERYRQKLW